MLYYMKRLEEAKISRSVTCPGRLGARYTGLEAQKRFFNFSFEDFF